jgi:CTP:molybdopterin cytidylyltransferase MocA
LSDNLPISEQYRIVAKRWVDAEAAASLMEDTKSAMLSQMMMALGDMPVSRAEMQAKASDEWKDFVEGMIEARKQANLLKVQLEYLRMRSAEWTSEEATKRAEMKL